MDCLLPRLPVEMLQFSLIPLLWLDKSCKLILILLSVISGLVICQILFFGNAYCTHPCNYSFKAAVNCHAKVTHLTVPQKVDSPIPHC